MISKNTSNISKHRAKVAFNYKILSSLFLCVTWHRMFIKPNHRCMTWVARYMCFELAVWIGLFYFAVQRLLHPLVLCNFVLRSVKIDSCSQSFLLLLTIDLLSYITLLTSFLYNHRNMFFFFFFSSVLQSRMDMELLLYFFLFLQWWVFLRLLWRLSRSTLGIDVTFRYSFFHFSSSELGLLQGNLYTLHFTLYTLFRWWQVYFSSRC